MITTTHINSNNQFTQIHIIRDSQTISKEKLHLYNSILDNISEINHKLAEIDHKDNYPYQFNLDSHRVIYDTVYVLECLVYARMKKLESEMEKERYDHDKEEIKKYF